MRALFMIVLTSCSTVLFCPGVQTGTAAGGVLPAYELYSWQNPKGEWDFALLYMTNHQKSVRDVFKKKSVLHGLKQLERRISKLPSGADVVWFDRLTVSGVRLKGSEGLKYPPREIVDAVKRYSAERGVVVSGPEHQYP